MKLKFDIDVNKCMLKYEHGQCNLGNLHNPVDFISLIWWGLGRRLKKKSSVTIYDVARRCGLSPKTVSRVINGGANVSPRTRERVESSIAALDFTPNLVARGLRTDRSKRLGIVTLNAEHPVRIRAMEIEARRLDYTLSFYSINPLDEKDFVATFNVIRAQMIDGIAVITPHSFISYAQLRAYAKDTPLVLINSHIEKQMPSVGYDQANGTRLATEHLLSLGHRAICGLSGPIGIRIDAEIRHRTFVDTMRAFSDHEPVTVQGGLTAESGYAATDKLLSSGPSFTAMICFNDVTALGAIHRLRHAGLNVPQDVSVVGYDDIDFASFLHTPLTTVRQDFDLLARKSVAYLAELIEDSAATPEQRLLIPDFILRESTAKPASINM